MLFSVVVPCFNSKSSLRPCLDSILIQDFSDFEVIVINDGSTDGSDEILKEYDNKYQNVHTYAFSNAGVSQSRKRGVSLATGEYVIFVDSDDTINPHLLFELNDTIQKNSFPDLVRYQTNLVGDNIHKDHQRYNYTEHLNTIHKGTTALKNWSTPGKKYAVYWLFAFKRELFSDISFASELRCYEDVALIPLLVAKSKTVITIGYIGYNYTYNNSKSLTNTQSLEAERSRAIDFLRAFQYATKNFAKLSNVSDSDIDFFVKDYTRRLHGKYESLPDVLKTELYHLFNK